jgi:hypothetical protein
MNVQNHLNLGSDTKPVGPHPGVVSPGEEYHRSPPHRGVTLDEESYSTCLVNLLDAHIYVVLLWALIIFFFSSHAIHTYSQCLTLSLFS